MTYRRAIIWGYSAPTFAGSEMSINPSGQPPRSDQQGPKPPQYMLFAPGPPQQETTPGRNRWAVACLVCGLVGVLGFPILLCWIFGYMALFQIARTGQTGRLLVYLGFSASGIWMLVILFRMIVMNSD